MALVLNRKLILDIQIQQQFVTGSSQTHPSIWSLWSPELQKLSKLAALCYMDSTTNPANDITRGRTLAQLVEEKCWGTEPNFFWLTVDAKGAFGRT